MATSTMLRRNMEYRPLDPAAWPKVTFWDHLLTKVAEATPRSTLPGMIFPLLISTAMASASYGQDLSDEGPSNHRYIVELL